MTHVVTGGTSENAAANRTMKYMKGITLGKVRQSNQSMMAHKPCSGFSVIGGPKHVLKRDIW